MFYIVVEAWFVQLLKWQAKCSEQSRRKEEKLMRCSPGSGGWRTAWRLPTRYSQYFNISINQYFFPSQEKESKEDEMHQVTSTVEKTLAQNQRLSSELKNFVNKNKELNAKVKTLQAMMEKVRNCAFLFNSY